MKHPKVKIRNLEKKDISMISELLMDMWVYHAKNDNLVDAKKLHECKVEEYLKTAIESEDVIAKVAEIDGEIAGFIRAELRVVPSFYFTDKELYIDDLITVKKFRRNGVASLLVDECINFAKEKNVKLITSKIYQFNEASKELFNKKGFGIDFSYYSIKEIND